jgi:hypothetical protein
MSSPAKVKRLEARLAAGCPPPGVRRVVQLIVVCPGEPEPQLPDMPPCPRCGRGHDLRLIEQIVLVGADGKEAPP